MPDIGGGEVRQTLKDDPNTRDMPVLILTGLMTKEEANTGSFFIAKPINSKELLKK